MSVHVYVFVYIVGVYINIYIYTHIHVYFKFNTISEGICDRRLPLLQHTMLVPSRWTSLTS